jgi:hypothetical protein
MKLSLAMKFFGWYLSMDIYERKAKMKLGD